jgi:hypothetical protein
MQAIEHELLKIFSASTKVGFSGRQVPDGSVRSRGQTRKHVLQIREGICSPAAAAFNQCKHDRALVSRMRLSDVHTRFPMDERSKSGQKATLPQRAAAVQPLSP